MNTSPEHPLRELTRFIAASIGLSRASRRFEELMGWEAAEDIAKDLLARERQIAAKAHAAEQNAILAVQAIEEAQRPESEGGENITPAEAKRIRRHDEGAVRDAHDACELATA